VTADNQAKNQGDPNPALTSTITGFQNGENSAVVSGLTLTTTAINSSPAGAYAIVPSSASAANYVFNYINGVLTVTGVLPPSGTNTGVYPLYEALGEDGSNPKPLSEHRDGVKKCGTFDGALPASASTGDGVVCASIINLDRHASRIEPQKFSQLTRQ
jgi:hypothetical protein